MPVEKTVTLGRNVIIYHPDQVNLYGCEIGDGTKIGSFVEIRNSVKIGKNVKIQAFAFLPEGIIIEDGVFIGPHATFVNDTYPRSINPDGSMKGANDWEIESTIVKKGASIGANATILCGIKIGEYAIVGAGAVVTVDVPPNTIVAGSPARIIREVPDKGIYS